MSIAAEARRQQIEATARDIWTHREQGFPKRIRQTWEQGTELARQATLLQAAVELGYLPANTPPKVKAPDLATAPDPSPEGQIELPWK